MALQWHCGSTRTPETVVSIISLSCWAKKKNLNIRIFEFGRFLYMTLYSVQVTDYRSLEKRETVYCAHSRAQATQTKLLSSSMDRCLVFSFYSLQTQFSFNYRTYKPYRKIHYIHCVPYWVSQNNSQHNRPPIPNWVDFHYFSELSVFQFGLRAIRRHEFQTILENWFEAAPGWPSFQCWWASFPLRWMPLTQSQPVTKRWWLSCSLKIQWQDFHNVPPIITTGVWKFSNHEIQ